MSNRIACALLCATLLSPQIAAKKVIPTGSKLDIESFNNNIDLGTDISQLSLSDLRILRNAFAARQGYCFSDYALRAVFSQTSWYDTIMVAYESSEEKPPIKYTKAEKAFVEKIKAREAELMRRNHDCKAGERVNVANIVNPFQLEAVSEPLNRRLARDGFAIVPRKNIQLFHCYENNDYHDFPNFITTDMFLQLFHVYFSRMLQELESKQLAPLMAELCRGMYDELASTLATAQYEPTKQAAEFGIAYFGIARRLMGDNDFSVPEQCLPTVDDELAKIAAERDAFSEYLGYNDTYFMYSKFRPRGYYTRTDTLKRYFRAMSWMQMASTCVGGDGFMLMADLLNRRPELRATLERISTPISFLVGQPDDVSLLDLADVVRGMGKTFEEISKDKPTHDYYVATVLAMAQSRTRIIPKEPVSCPYKESVMPQRYLYDSEVLLRLVDVDTQPTSLRPYPMGLDVMAAFGSATAESIAKESTAWPLYASNLAKVKSQMDDLAKDTTLYNLWMKSLATMHNDSDDRYPYFMQTPQWAKKNLNTALASWTELRHDVSLYAKQPMAAECGGVIPDPVVVGYVEPNVAYWKKAVEIVRHTADILDRFGLLNGKVANLTTQMEEQASFLLGISAKELEGESLTAEEYKSIELLGSTYEWLTLEILNGDSADGGTWEDVSGSDRSVSVVADVFTANSSNNPDKGVLEEGVGFVDDIFVVVEIDGLLHLTRGAVFSYRELRSGMNDRLTDEQWQRKLEKSPRYGVPKWMDEIILPDSVPADNELMFYSSGC